jgi:hypothetical protein
MLFRKCLIRSLTALIIAIEACTFAYWASEKISSIMSSWMLGCLTTNLWSRCLTNIDSKTCVFCPATTRMLKHERKKT